MEMNLEAKERQLEDALKEAREIRKRDDLNDEERADLKSRTEVIQKMRDEVAEDKAIRKALAEESGVTEEELVKDAQVQKSIGELYVKSEEYKSAGQAGFRGSSGTFKMRDPDKAKAEPTVIDILGPTAALAGLLTPDRLNQILGLSSYPTTLEALLPHVDIGTASEVTYFLEDSETDDIGFVAEGAEKPNFTLDGSEQTDKVELVAGFAALTRQTLANAAFMAGFVNTRMQLKIQKVKEDAILNGNGTGAPDGFFNRSINTYSQETGDTVMDAIYKATVKGWEEGGYPTDRVVIRPSDWTPIVLSKDGNERYYGAGPFAAAVGDTIWGLPVTKSAFVPASHVLVGPFQAGSLVITRGGQQVRTSDSHADYFKKNKVALLLEEEIGLVVFTLGAFVDMTITES